MSTSKVLFVVLVLLAIWNAQAQEPPCAGQVEHTVVEGVGIPSVLAVENHRLVSSDGPTVSNWRLTDTISPEPLGRWTTWDEQFGSFFPIVLDERGFAYAGFGEGTQRAYSIRIWDLRAGGEPRPLAVLPGRWIDFFVDGDLLMGVRSPDDLVAFDVGNPAQPVLICEQCGGIELDNGPLSYSDEHLRITGADDLAVILDYDKILVIDTSLPSAPVVLSMTTPSRLYGPGCQQWSNDRVAVLASDIFRRLEIVDLANPGQPTVVEFDADASDSAWGDFHGDVLIFRDEYTPSARRLNVADPALPVFLPPISFDSWPRSGAVWDGHLYVGTGTDIRVVDLAGTPTEVGAGPPARYANRIAVSGSTGFALGGQVLITFDLGNPTGPSEAARLNVDWWPFVPATDGSFGAVHKAGPGGVALLDLRDVSNPLILDTVPTGGAIVTEIEVGNGLLAVAARNDGVSGWVELWEISFAAPPLFHSRIDVGEPVWQLEMVGDRMFLGLLGAIVEVGIADPTAPVVGPPLSLQHVHSSVTGLAIVGDELFAKDSYTVAVVDISVPGSPVERPVVNHSLTGPTWLVAGGDNVVAGSSSAGLVVMQSPPADGVIPMIDLRPPVGSSGRGGISGDVLYLAGGHRLSTMDLGCAPLAADFTWYQMDTAVRFIDNTTFDDWEWDRSWIWTTDHDPMVHGTRSPLIDFGATGTYQVTMEITTETGVVSVAKSVEVIEHPDGGLVFIDGFEFGNTAAWLASP